MDPLNKHNTTNQVNSTQSLKVINKHSNPVNTNWDLTDWAHSLVVLLMRDLWMWGMTPPPAMVPLMRVSSSSSPLIANCRCLGVILFTFRSLLAFPASSSTSAVRYSRIAAEYTAAVAPTRPWAAVLDFRWRWIRPTGNWIHSKVKQNISIKDSKTKRYFLKLKEITEKLRRPHVSSYITIKPKTVLQTQMETLCCKINQASLS